MRSVLFACIFLLGACAASADRADEATASSALDEARARVCSWNIRRLGHRFDGRDKNIGGTAAVIEDHCDVVAVQEVMQLSGGLVPGYDALLAALGEEWGGLRTDRARPDTTSSNAERYAFLYRKSEAAPCAGWLDRVDPVPYITDDDAAFLREPAFTCLKVRVHARDLLIASYHAIYSDGVPATRREVTVLDDDRDGDGEANDVVRAMRAERPGADVVFVGDFNLKPHDLATSLPTFKDLTLGSGSTINNDDEITANLYDHIVVAGDETLATTVTPAEVLDVRSYAHGSADDDSYYRSISDHLPVRFLLGP